MTVCAVSVFLSLLFCRVFAVASNLRWVYKADSSAVVMRLALHHYAPTIALTQGLHSRKAYTHTKQCQLGCHGTCKTFYTQVVARDILRCMFFARFAMHDTPCTTCSHNVLHHLAWYFLPFCISLRVRAASTNESDLDESDLEQGKTR